VVLEFDVTNIYAVFLKSDFLLVMAMMFFVEFNEVDFGVTKVVLLAHVIIADLEVHVVVNNGEFPVAEGVMAPFGLVSSVFADGGVPVLAVVSESHVDAGVHLVKHVAGMDVEVCVNEVDSDYWHF